MKKLLCALAALASSIALAATTIPVQMISPTGSTSGQAIVSTGATAPAWSAIVNSIAGQTGAVTLIGIGLGSTSTPTFYGVTLNGSTAHGVLLGGGSGAPITYTSAGTSGQPLVSNGSSADPAFSSNLGAINFNGSANTLTAAGSATSAPVTLTAGGSDTNVGVSLLAKGSTTISLGNSTGNWFAATGPASPANYLRADGAAAGSGVTLEAVGTDTNIGVSITPKGTGAVTVGGAATVTGALTGAAGSFTTLAASGNDALLYSTLAGQSVANGTATTITTWTKTFDRVNANFNATTGVFTAPATGYYLVDGQVAFSSHTGVVGGQYSAVLNANGVQVRVGSHNQETTASVPVIVQVGAVVFLSAGQTLTLQAFQNTGSTLTLTTSATASYLSIARMP